MLTVRRALPHRFQPAGEDGYSTFLYTPGTFSASVTPSINGQILAGSAASGSVSITNSFALTFSNAAAQTIPGTTTQSGSTTTTPTVTGVRRYVSK